MRIERMSNLASSPTAARSDCTTYRPREPEAAYVLGSMMTVHVHVLYDSAYHV